MKLSSTAFFLFAALQVFAFLLGMGIAGTGFGGLFGAQTKSDEDIGTRLLLLGGFLALLAPVLLLLSLLSGFGLRAGKGWGPRLSLITACLALLEFPLGTGFAVYWLVKTFRKAGGQ